MSALETHIDALYALPLANFTEARNALAKSLAGEERARVKRLEKPTVVAWAVNQIYWHERSAWNRLVAAGRALRSVQLAALTGTAGDLRDASTAHRTAVSAAVAAAHHVAERHGAHPAADDIARMLGAISLAAEPPAAPGRFAQAVQPAGFEALAGVTPTPPPQRPNRPTLVPAVKDHRVSAARTAAEAERRRVVEAARATAEAAVTEARATLAAAEADVVVAQKAADVARRELVQAEHAAQTARVMAERARSTLNDREARLRTL